MDQNQAVGTSGNHESAVNASVSPISDSVQSVTQLSSPETLTDIASESVGGAVSHTDVAVGLLQSEALSDQLVEFMHIGGPVVWVLTVFSVVALTIILVKLFQFFVERPETSKHLDGVLAQWREGKVDWALNQLNDNRPVDQLVRMSIQGQQQGLNMQVLKEELERVATQRLERLSAYLRPLEVIATISPLLGLLGTVLGMIEAFQQMQAAGSQVDPSVLSGGIWKALFTTAVGLTVAIPVMLAFNWMERKVERVSTLMNDAVTRSFTGTVITHTTQSNTTRDAA